MRKVNVGGIKVGGGEPFALIAGPCVIEGEKLTRRVAASLRDVTAELGIPSSSNPPLTKPTGPPSDRSEDRGSTRG